MTNDFDSGNVNVQFPSLAILAALLLFSATAFGQTFSSGSDGSDGPLNLPVGSGVVVFDPFDSGRWGRVLDQDGDGVYQFSAITIAAGVTLQLRGDKVNRPMYWLAQNDVSIAGTVDLRGGNAGYCTHGTVDLDQRRQVAVPGAGGYAGGAGGRISPALPATAGEGPGGGSGGLSCPVYGATAVCGRGGRFTGNRSLAPLVGGSGGEGGSWPTSIGGGGGAGGGAILIASSTAITVNGVINAAGTACGQLAGSGSGGAIRLVAPTVTGTGTFAVFGGPIWSEFAGSEGGSGLVRLEANNHGPSFSFNPPSGAVVRGAPGHPSTLKPMGSIRITAVDHNPVSLNPSGLFQIPDVTISSGGPVAVDIEGTGIPPGTVVTLNVYPEVPADAVTLRSTAQATLQGTLELSTATATFTFPFGYSKGWVRATWTQ